MPRSGVIFDGITEPVASYLIDDATITYDATEVGGSAQIGRSVNLSAAGTVQLTPDAEVVLGKLLRVEADGVAAVQTNGYITLPGGVAAALTLGSKIVGAASAVPADGYIREVDPAVLAEVAVARGIIIDATDPTAVVVLLD